MKKCGIYKITNTIDGKMYIGKSVDCKQRFYEHILDLNQNKHYNQYLQNSYNKYSKDNFKFEIFFLCSRQDLNNHEIYFINYFKTNNREFGYNLTSGGEGLLNQKHSKLSIIKMSNAHKGYKNPMYGKTHKDTSICRSSKTWTSKPIIQYDLNNNFIKEWKSITEIINILNFNRSGISLCCSGTLKKSKGFIWKYKHQYKRI